jgi:hypothetical protein
MMQAGDEGDGFPLSLRNMTDQPLAARAAAPDTDHTRRDVSDLTTKLAASTGKAAANKTRASLSTFFGWCMEKGLIEEKIPLGVLNCR